MAVADVAALENGDLVAVSLDAEVVAAMITECLTVERPQAPAHRRLVAELFADLVDYLLDLYGAV